MLKVMTHMLIFSTSLGGRTGSEAVYALLKSAFSSYCTDDFPPIEKTANGKPFFPGRPDIHFSLSHTKTHVLCAISDTPVGCDIECADRKISLRAQKFFCSSSELELFDPLDLWVLKESYIKVFGETFASIRHQRFSRDGERIILPDPLTKSRLYDIDGCRAGVCAQSEDFPPFIRSL